MIKPISSNSLIYGNPGVGKTYLASTVQEVVRDMEVPTFNVPDGWIVKNTTLLINAEFGEQGVANQYRDIVIKKVEDYKTFCKCYEFIRLQQHLIKQENVEQLLKIQTQFFGEKINQHKILFLFQAIIIDSITEIQKYCIYDLLGINQNTKLDDELETMTIRLWGSALEKILLTCRRFRNLQIISIIIAQVLEESDDKGKKYSKPSLQGQARNGIVGFFDFVGYYVLNAKENQSVRRLFLSPVGPFVAKARFDGFNESYIDNPSYKKLLSFTIKQEEKNKFPYEF